MPSMIEWALGKGYDLTLIGTIPLGEIDEDLTDQYLPLSQVRSSLIEMYSHESIPYKTGGPARYNQVKETSGRLGFITPLTHYFANVITACALLVMACSTYV